MMNVILLEIPRNEIVCRREISVNSIVRWFVANARKVIRRRRGRTLFLLSLVALIVHFLYNFNDVEFQIQQREHLNVLCFDDHRGLITPAAEGFIMKPDILPIKWTIYDSQSSFNDSDDRIFFHETSGRNDVSMKQCCAVESAAKHHPDRPVQLFLRPSVNYCSYEMKEPDHSTLLYNPTWLQVLSKYPNVQVILLNHDQYFRGYPLEDWYNKGEWRKSKYEIAHLSDYIRMLNLLKGGGLYLDIDIITLKPYDSKVFRDFLVYGNTNMDEISNGAMHLKRGHWLTKKIVKLISKEYEPDAYIYNGPDAISEVVRKACGLVASQPQSNRCKDLRILPYFFFYPIPSIFSHLLFQEQNNKTQDEIRQLLEIQKSYGLHLWNFTGQLKKKIRINSNQTVAIAARENCPITAKRTVDFKSLGIPIQQNNALVNQLYSRGFLSD